MVKYMQHIKYVLLGIFICIVTLTILFMINIFIKRNSDINVKDISSYSKVITKLNDDINALDTSEECQEALFSMVDRINATHFSDGTVSLREYVSSYYAEDLKFTDYYEQVVNQCSIEDDTDEIYVKALSATVFPEEQYNRYQLSHEFTIEDFYNRNNLRKSHEQTGTYTTKSWEIMVLRDLIEVIK